MRFSDTMADYRAAPPNPSPEGDEPARDLLMGSLAGALETVDALAAWHYGAFDALVQRCAVDCPRVAEEVRDTARESSHRLERLREVLARRYRRAREHVRLADCAVRGLPYRPISGDCDIAELLREVAEVLGPPAQLAAVDVEVHERAHAIADVDADHLFVALLESATLALAAAGEGGRVRLGVDRAEEHLTIEVSGSGDRWAAGLAELSDAVPAPHHTEALRWALVREVARAHRGTVEASDTDAGPLGAVRFALPLGRE